MEQKYRVEPGIISFIILLSVPLEQSDSQSLAILGSVGFREQTLPPGSSKSSVQHEAVAATGHFWIYMPTVQYSKKEAL